MLETDKNMRYPPSTASNGAPTCKGHTDWHTKNITANLLEYQVQPG